MANTNAALSGLSWLEWQNIGSRRFSDAVLNQATPGLPDSNTPIDPSRWESVSFPSVSAPPSSAQRPEPPALGLGLELALERNGEGNSHAALQAVAARLSENSAGKGAESADSRCLCPVCSQLEVINANLETLEAPSAEPAAAGTSSSISLASSLDLSKTFFLHSNPNANHTIYLDFDGHSMASSQWENGGALQLRPFYSDFTSSTTLLEIQRIWQRMVEDFSPFNVNVTTQEPNTEDLRKSGSGDTRWGLRMAFTYNTNLVTGNAITNAGGGGTAYYNSFNWSTDEVALGFNRGEYAAAETGSHEVGHAINLRHDGGSYGSNASYYEGHGGTGPTSWGTIMGASFIGSRENLTTWSKGQYIGANNQEDDLSIITTQNGFGYRNDDHGNSLASATLLQGVSFSQFGIIERNTDIDWFRFDTGSGNVTLNITNACRVFTADGLGGYTTEYLTARGPNLDISASLYRSDGTWIATSNSLDQINASFSNINLDAGSYCLAIDGVGMGDPYSNPPSGYTDYASLGQYMLSGTVQPTVQSPSLVLSQTDNLVTSESGSTASFSVKLSEAPGADVTVSVASSNSAEGTVSPASLTFTTTNWATAQSVTVTGVDDSVVDGPQAYVANLTSSSTDPAYQGLSSSVSLTNLDNDLPILSLSPTSTTVVEGQVTSVSYTVNLSSANPAGVTVNYATANGSATAGSDYTASSGTLSFAAAETSKTITINLLNDSLNEPDETFSLSLSAPTNATLASPSSVTTTLTDTLVASSTTTLTAGIENLQLTGTNAINGTGNSGANVITGNSGANVLKGGGGIDTLTGLGGIDTFDLSGINIAANRCTITDFVTGSGGEITRLSNSLTSRSSSGSGASMATFTTAVSRYDLNTSSTGNDIFAFNFTSSTTLAGVTNGTALLDGLIGSGSATLKTSTKGGRGYLLAYNNGDAFLYAFNAGGGSTTNSTTVSASEIALIATFDNSSAFNPGAFVQTNFNLV